MGCYHKVVLPQPCFYLRYQNKCSIVVVTNEKVQLIKLGIFGYTKNMKMLQCLLKLISSNNIFFKCSERVLLTVKLTGDYTIIYVINIKRLLITINVYRPSSKVEITNYRKFVTFDFKLPYSYVSRPYRLLVDFERSRQT